MEPEVDIGYLSYFVLCCCDKTSQLKVTREKDGLISAYRSQSLTEESHAETQGRNLEVGSEAEAVEKHCLLNLSQALFSYHFYEVAKEAPFLRQAT